MNTEIANAVNAAGDKAQYDTRVKRLLAQKSILAHILVKTIDEFKGMKPEDVVKYIEGEPSISVVPVELGLANMEKTDATGPGFINFYLKSDVIYDALANLLKAGSEYGNLPKQETPRIQVEYVSANPTGPLHVGHGRGAAFGSALVNLMRAAGYNVSSEYYINDAGKQIDNLALSVNARYLELLGKEVEFPENGYHGQDIIETAKRIIAKDGDKYLNMSDEERLSIFKELALKEKLAALKEDLAKIDEKVNCMKSDSTFNSTLTEFLSNTSKKSNDNEENADEGGKSLALLGFEKYNLLEGKCYSSAAQCADATGYGCLYRRR